MHTFEIHYYSLTNQIIIPHRDPTGRLIGIRARNLNPRDITDIGKSLPVRINGISLSHPLGANLYGLNKTLPAIKKSRRILLFEAEKSVMQLYSYYGKAAPAAALCGSHISQSHIALLKTLPLKEIILAFDRDYKAPNTFKARRWKNTQIRKALPLLDVAPTSLIIDDGALLDYKDSPSDKGRDTFETLYHNRLPITKALMEKGH